MHHLHCGSIHLSSNGLKRSSRQVVCCWFSLASCDIVIIFRITSSSCFQTFCRLWHHQSAKSFTRRAISTPRHIVDPYAFLQDCSVSFGLLRRQINRQKYAKSSMTLVAQIECEQSGLNFGSRIFTRENFLSHAPSIVRKYTFHRTVAIELRKKGL